MSVSDDGVELVWPGKYDADGRRARLPATGVGLVERERHGDSPPTDAITDTIVLGDNLLALEALVARQPGSVDLVYIDPPFATGSAFALARKLPDASELRLPAFDDAWTGGVAEFLRMLDPRLRLIHALLSPTGSLYVHVDPHVGHAVKLLLDDIFGRASFQREIVWRIGWVSGFKTRARNWIRNHDLIFFYTKDPSEFTFNKSWVPHASDYERRDGAAGKSPGIAIDDVWNAGLAEIELVGRESLDSIQIKSFSREKTGWATQKNESLLRRIISASSNPGDLVADPFGGSGTTAAVAHELGRHFVTGDHSEAAVQITRDRLLAAGAEHLRVHELDGVERSTAMVALGDSLLAELLAQVDGEPLAGARGPIVATRGPVGIAVGLPGSTIDDARLLEIRTDAARLGLASIEVLAFDWADSWSRVSVEPEPQPVDAEIELVRLQVGRGFWQSSVRATPWLSGGVGVWERPRVRVELGQRGDSLVQVQLRDLSLIRPECAPESLRKFFVGPARDPFATLLGWSIVSARDASVRFAVRRERKAELSRVSTSIAAGPSLSLVLDDIRGHRCVVGLPG